MIIKSTKILTLAVLLLLNVSSSKSQELKAPVNRILFIFDASQSMLGRWESGRKIDIAKKLLSNMVDSLKEIENLEIGLRVYGHQKGYPPQDCNDSKLEINFTPANMVAERMKAKLSMIRARGTTPIAISLEEGAKDLEATGGDARNIVILITDGKEECGMDPCAVSRLYQRKEIILKPFVIGVGLNKEWKKSFDCVGRFFDASKEEDFSNILNVVLSHVINNTTAQVNLLDENNEPNETNVNLTFYNDFTGVEKYNYLHTMNAYGNPDTMIIDPVLSYQIVAHTIPPVSVDNIIITPGKHTTIPIKTPQGTLKITMNTKQNYPCIIRKSGKTNTLHVQEVNTSEKYLVGSYDIEVLSLPRLIYTDIEIKQSTEAKLPIPPPGLANINLPSKGYGGLYLKDGDNFNLIYPFNAKKSQHKLTLLPGNYKVVFRALAAKEYIYTKEKDFKLKSGQSKLIKLY